MAKINGAKVFTVPTSESAEKDALGDKLTEWIVENPFITIEEKHVVQSDSFLTVLIFFSGKAGGVSPLS